MAVPALRIPLGLDTQSFEKSVNDAKSLTSSATNFIVKEFAKSQLKLVVNSDQFRPAIQGAAQFAGQQFDKVKPQIQAFTQSAVKETTEAGLKVANVFASPAIKGSFQAFTAVGIPAATGLAQSLAPLALKAFAVYEAVNLVASAISAARAQIESMVEVADRASKLNLSPQFLQLFEGEARKLKVTTEELDGALANAFNATKEKSPIDVGKFEVAKERITDIELTLRVFNDQLAKAAGTQLQGLVLFRDADTQEQKVRAILTSMVELEKIGQRAASLEVGEKFFGSAFVDRIRQGKTSAESILKTMRDLGASQDGIFPDALVQRAKAVDEQLKLSEDRLSRALKPSFDDLAGTILTIRGYWSDVVDLMAKAVEYANKIGGTDLAGKRSELAEVNTALANGTALGGLPQFASGRTRLEGRAYKLRGEIANLEGATQGPELPKASRGVGPPPKLRATGGDEKRDPFDAAVDAVEKRTATIRADTAATFLNSAAQAGLRAEFQELTALKRSDSGVTQEQIDAYQRYRETMSTSQALTASGIKLTDQQTTAFLNSSHGIEQATKQYNSAQEKLTELNSASQALGSALSSGFADAILQGKSLNDVMSNLLTTIARLAINSAFASVFNAPASGGLSPAAGFLNTLIGKNAEGTDNWRGGLSWVGEKGPELVNLPRGAQVIPNNILRSGGGGQTFSPVYQINAAGADSGTVARIQQVLQTHAKAIQGQGRAMSSAQNAQMTGVG